MSVDLPRPDSPNKREHSSVDLCGTSSLTTGPTDDHGSKVEALLDTLPVDLVGQVGEADVAHEFFADEGRHAVRGRAGGLPVGMRVDI